MINYKALGKYAAGLKEPKEADPIILEEFKPIVKHTPNYVMYIAVVGIGIGIYLFRKKL